MGILNKWQWLWLAVSAFLLYGLVAIAIGSWPAGQESVRAQFGDPDCQFLREVPDDYRPAGPVQIDEPCAAIKMRIRGYGTVMRSAADYDRWILGLKVKSVLYTLLLWLMPVSVLYAAGSLIGRAMRSRRGESGSNRFGRIGFVTLAATILMAGAFVWLLQAVTTTLQGVGFGGLAVLVLMAVAYGWLVIVLNRSES